MGTNRAFLAFTLGPVQGFIADARSARDLWTGSFLLAHLIKAAMESVSNGDPEHTFVLPHESAKINLHAPSIPNRFIAEVSAERVNELAEAAKKACRHEWKRISEAVRKELGRIVEKEDIPHREGWDALWEQQVKTFFDIRTTVLQWDECDESVLNDWLADRRCRLNVSEADKLWSDRLELLMAVQAADKNIRHIPEYDPAKDGRDEHPMKCTLLGSYEQMGPSDLQQSQEFWKHFAEKVHPKGTHVRARERLCALSLVKRFAWAAKLHEIVGEKAEAMRLDDTATVAATRWLKEGTDPFDPAAIRREYKDWNGQWLHWVQPNQDKRENKCPGEIFHHIEIKRKAQGPPPTYYVILMLDGDRMGDKFSSGAGLKHRQSISHALAIFSQDHVPVIVEEHDGTLIYAGGDDVLALMPTAKALQCAKAISDRFQQVWNEHNLRKPDDTDDATASAGLAVVHYKEDLRFARNQAHKAEQQSKLAGRDLLTLTICRRSGEHTSALCPWSFVDTLARWIRGFQGDDQGEAASVRWAYHLASDLPTLEGLPVEAMEAEIRRQVSRSEEKTQRRLEGGAEAVVESFREYRNDMVKKQGGDSNATLLRHFITLCQSAAFLARGRDR